MALFTGVQHLCIFNIVPPPYLSPFCQMFGKDHTPSAHPSLLTFCIDRPFVLYWVPCSGSFTLEKRSNYMDSFGRVQWMFQNLLLPVAQEVCDSSNSVTPCIVMNDGVLYHQVLSPSLELWTTVVLQEYAVVESVYHLPWRYSMVQYYAINVICHNEHHLQSTL